MQRKTRYLLLTITAGFLLLTLVNTFHISGKYGGTDLRCRVVGARLLGTDQSPYFYQWQPGDKVFYLDPNAEAHRLVNGNVVTPATLSVIYPLAQLPYPRVRLIWTLLQILAAAGILWILFKNIPAGFLWASPVIIGFICSDLWFYHIDRGQMYIFYAFFLTLMYGCYTSRWKYGAFVSGVLGGLFILFRPFAGIIGLGFLLHKKMKWIFGCITGFIIGCLLFVAPQVPAWKDYFRAMDEYVKENLQQGHHDYTAKEPAKPAMIEGATNLTLGDSYNMDWMNTSYHALKRTGISITSLQSAFLYILIMIFLSVFFYRKRKIISSAQTLFLFGFLALILAELFVVAPRAAYNILQWIFPLSVIYLGAGQRPVLLIFLGLAVLLLHHFPFVFPFQGHLAELLFIGITAYYIFYPDPGQTIKHGYSRTG